MPTTIAAMERWRVGGYTEGRRKKDLRSRGRRRAPVGRRRAVEELRRRRRHGRRGVAAQDLGRRQAQALDEARVARPEAARRVGRRGLGEEPRALGVARLL